MENKAGRKEMKTIQVYVAMFVAGILTMAITFPAWGSLMTEETLAPPMESAETVGAIRRDLTARDGSDRIAEINKRLMELQGEGRQIEEALKQPLADEGELQGRLGKVNGEMLALIDERDRLTGQAGDGGRRTLAERIGDLKRHRRDLKTALGINRDDFTARADLNGRLEEVNAQLAAFHIGQDTFGTLDKDLLRTVAARARRVDEPVVVGYDIAYFAFNPDAWVRLWKYIRENPEERIGQVESGVIFALLPYALDERGSALQGINPDDLPKVFQELNAFAKRHTGEDVDLGLEDFGVRVPPELLGDIRRTLSHILAESGAHLTRIFAREEVAKKISGVRSPLIAYVFDLVFKEGTVGIELENLDAILVTEGSAFVKLYPVVVSKEAQAAILELRTNIGL